MFLISHTHTHTHTNQLCDFLSDSFSLFNLFLVYFLTFKFIRFFNIFSVWILCLCVHVSVNVCVNENVFIKQITNKVKQNSTKICKK